MFRYVAVDLLGPCEQRACRLCYVEGMAAPRSLSFFYGNNVFAKSTTNQPVLNMIILEFANA